MTLLRTCLGVAAAAALLAGSAAAEPGLILDLGARAEGSRNAAARRGAERWAAESGGEYIETQIAAEAQRARTLRRVADRGADPVVVLGRANAAALDEVAPAYPDTTFVIVGAEVERPNVASIGFATPEAGYLAGVAAAAASWSGIVGVLAGPDTAPRRTLVCAYRRGARAADPDIAILEDRITEAAPLAFETVQDQARRGADVIFAATGGAEDAILGAAAEAGILVIATQSAPAATPPDVVLARVIERIGTAVHGVFAAAEADPLAIGHDRRALADDGVALVPGARVTEEAAVAAARAAIVSDEIALADAATIAHDDCP